MLPVPILLSKKEATSLSNLLKIKILLGFIGKESPNGTDAP